MAYRLAIANTVQVPVKLELNDSGAAKQFSFTLTCDRLTREEIEARMKDRNTSARAVLVEVTKGWSGQNLVLDEVTGQPAGFSEAAFAAMLDIAGMPGVLFASYVDEVNAKRKN